MKMYSKIISVVLSLVIVLGMLVAVPAVSAETTFKGATIELTAECNYGYAFEVLRQLNELRAEQGLGALKMNPRMLEDAMQRSAEIAVKFSHTRPDGSDCFTINNEIWGENIALGQNSPTAVMTSWINSPGHYANMITSYYDSVGIGSVVHNGVIYWTQVFGMSETEGAATSDEIDSREFSVYLGDNTYSVELSAPDKLFAGDSGELRIMGTNSEWSTKFVLNNDDFDFVSDCPDVIAATNDAIEALSAGTATVTASNSALSVSARVEVVEFSAGQSRQCGDNIFWDYKDGTLILSGTGRMYDYETLYEFYEITKTDVPWTDGFDSVKKLVVGEGITYIGSSAFAHFNKLTSVQLPSTLTEIGEGAFARNLCLYNLTLPDSVSKLSEGVFTDCYNLRSINLPDGLSEIPPFLFENCESLVKLELPESVHTIGRCAFLSCSALSTVKIPRSLTTLEHSAFFGCSHLREIDIPYGITEIHSGTFNGCKSLSSVTVNNPLTKFGTEDMFSLQKDMLTIYGYRNSTAQTHAEKNKIEFVPFDALKLDVTVTGYNKVYDGAAANEDLRLSFISTPDEYTVRYSRGEGFNFGYNTESIKALADRYINSYYDSDPGYLTDCGAYPVSYCVLAEGYDIVTATAYIEIDKATPVFTYEKSEVEIPYYTENYNESAVINSLLNMGDIGTYDLTYTSDNESVATVSSWGGVRARGYGECTITATFAGDDNLYPHSVSFKLSTYPVGRYTVGDFGFVFSEDRTAVLAGYYGNDASVTLPADALGCSISEVAHSAFFLEYMEEVIVPEGITYIGSSAFASSPNLSKVELSDTVEVIDDYAFGNCTSLTTIDIPRSVATIDEMAFLDCRNMHSVVIPESVKYIGEKAFGYNYQTFGGETVKNDGFVIYGHRNTAAEEYATENGFRFVDLDAPVPLYALGDVNRDGNVNVRDATAIQKNIAGLMSFDEEQMLLADFNEDTNLNIRDATQIQKKIAGLV